LEPWYKNALDIAAGGSFVLSSHKESSKVVIMTKQQVDDIITLLATTKEIIEKYARRLHNKDNLEHLELFSKDIISELEDKMPNNIRLPGNCEEVFAKDDKTLSFYKKGYYA
jgi:hypothetical protein